MGAGASALSTTLPPRIDKATALTLAGDEFDEAQFDAQATDGTVSREAFLRAAKGGVAEEGATRTWDAQKADAATVTVALSLSQTARSSFLGAEVKEKSDAEQAFIDAWQALNRGDVDSAIACADKLLALDVNNEKAYYTRAVAYARSAKWRHALSDYSSYIKLLQQPSGPALASPRSDICRASSEPDRSRALPRSCEPLRCC